MLLLSRSLGFIAAVCTLGAAANPTKRAGCSSTLTSATNVAKRIQSHYWNIVTGEYSGDLWTDVNTLEDIHNLMLLDGTTTWDSVADESYLGRIVNTGIPSWSKALDGSWDDAQWVILALWKIADYKDAHGEDSSAYKTSAEVVYNMVAAQWDTGTCGGGVWWSSDKNYKNAITNELFVLTSAEGYIRNQNQTYLDNAQKTWAWLEGSGIRNSAGLWNDGLDDSTCKNNGATTWTYNQGVIASGLAALYKTTENSTLLDQAEITLDATISQLTENNILKESCDNVASGAAACDPDQQYFKGAWTKHLQYYLDYANDATRTAKYSPFLGSLTSAIVHYGIDADHDVSSTWYAANEGGGVFHAQTDASGLAALNSAAKYGPC